MMGQSISGYYLRDIHNILKNIVPDLQNFEEYEEKLKLEGDIKIHNKKELYEELMLKLNDFEKLNFFKSVMRLCKDKIKTTNQYEKLEKMINNITPSIVIKNDFSKTELLATKRLTDYIKGVDECYLEEKYDMSITFCYTMLENFYKEYLLKTRTMDSKVIENMDLPKKAKSIKDYLCKKYLYTDNCVEKEMLTTFATLTYLIGRVRNKASAAHDGIEAQKWQTEYIRNLTFSIVNLLINFMPHDN